MLRVSKIFNLNDPGWGRGNQNGSGQNEPPKRPTNQGDGPPDLDQVWADFNNRIKSVFGNKKGGGGGFGKPPRAGGFNPSPKAAKFGIVFIVIVALLLWLASGFYIVREGQVGVVTQFGKYLKTVQPGFQWHIPRPVQNVELVDIASVRSFSVGYRDNSRNKVLPEALMLTEDENIVDVQFDVQYRLKAEMPLETGEYSPAADYIFRLVSPDESVRQAAETAMREVVGKQSMNKILYESRTAAAMDVMRLMQQILDRYQSGIEVTTVAIQNVQPPEQVQAAFEDAIKAGQDNERQKNEGNAYASKVIPEARGQASRMLQDAEGYRATVVGQAQGQAARFESIEKEYAKAPEITRERMYISTLEDVFKNASKVMVDTEGGNNMMYLPIDKLIEQTSSATSAPAATSVPSSAVTSSSNPASVSGNDVSAASRNRLSRDNFDRR
ncbi:FtsH protease activity modulator HflK [Advenella alkanexedens]|jgi:membrane protease subunit HflK|uniref:Protein HflK n=1 Tax=Advenella alkanexedens TaxID=1481665 RepID=A0ABS6NJ28_9BURK|nr:MULTISPECIES: FtsH protease activity modulator HflK [Advenella]MBV4395643.1 FtsH protease activity modulator HflK [Advenella alkanexedens]MDD3758056.1 FtsH protease activity modulator HflK [Advenella sp.]NLN66977.1 FtsH protease activity modulator HflK [Alcaligenaceae bacterium]